MIISLFVLSTKLTLILHLSFNVGVPVTSSTKTKQASKPFPTAQKVILLQERVVSCISVIKINFPLTQKRDSTQQKLSSSVQELQSSIESKDMELVINKQTATEAQNARDIARGRLDDIGKKAVEVQSNVAMLTKISSDTQDQLELKRKNLEALRKGSRSKEEHFKGDIDHTHKEIQELQEELKAVQAELASEMEKARSLPEQLQQAKKELAEKSVRVQELESAQQKLETSLENQRERVDLLLMQKSAASDLQQHNIEIKVLIKCLCIMLYPT